MAINGAAPKGMSLHDGFEAKSICDVLGESDQAKHLAAVAGVARHVAEGDRLLEQLEALVEVRSEESLGSERRLRFWIFKKRPEIGPDVVAMRVGWSTERAVSTTLRQPDSVFTVATPLS